MFFLQMSGFPGSGKSTLAKEIARRTNAVLVDHDVVKSALLEKLGERDTTLAGGISYHVEWAMIEANLAIGNSVILDSPCLYETMIEKGEALVKKYRCNYKYIECYIDDMEIINQRLTQRERMPSQIKEITSETAFQNTLASSQKPTKHPFITIDTSQPLDTYIQQAMDYILPKTGSLI